MSKFDKIKWYLLIKLGFYKKDFEPIRCTLCFYPKMTLITKDRIEGTVCECEIRCAKCMKLTGYWSYGQHGI